MITKTDNGDGTTTITFTYTANTQRITDGLTNVARYLILSGSAEGDSDNLTNTQIGAIVDEYVLQALKDAAKAYYVQSQTQEARTNAILYSEDNLF